MADKTQEQKDAAAAAKEKARAAAKQKKEDHAKALDTPTADDAGEGTGQREDTAEAETHGQDVAEGGVKAEEQGELEAIEGALGSLAARVAGMEEVVAELNATVIALVSRVKRLEGGGSGGARGGASKDGSAFGLVDNLGKL